MQPRLSEGALSRIMNGEDAVDKPILQVLGVKKNATATAGDRYKLMLFDGVSTSSSTLLARQLNDLASHLSDYSIVQIEYIVSNMVNNGGLQRNVMVILNMIVLVPGHQVGRALGSIDASNPRQEEAAAKAPSDAARQQRATSLFKTNNVNPVKSTQSNGRETCLTTISTLTPFYNRWMIKARVTNKSIIRTWSNARGEGRLFSMDLIDETGEIRCTAFGNECDKFFNIIEIGKVYYISHCKLKLANKQYNNLNNDYEMTMTNETDISVCNEEIRSITHVQYNFAPINAVSAKAKDDIIDVLGLVKNCGDVQTVTTRTTGREYKKRNIDIVDENNDMITVALWGDQALNFDGSSNPVVAIKRAKISEFQGRKNLSLTLSSVFEVDPDISQAHRLKEWGKTVCLNQESHTLPKSSSGDNNLHEFWATLKEAENFGQNAMPIMFFTKASVQHIKNKSIFYKACLTEGCKRKVIDQNNGMYICEKCQKCYHNFMYRFITDVKIADLTGEKWVTIFNDEAEVLFNATAQELGELDDTDSDAFIKKVKAALYKSFIFNIKLSEQTYNNETRLKATAVSIQPIKYSIYCDKLLKKIQDLIGIKN